MSTAPLPPLSKAALVAEVLRAYVPMLWLMRRRDLSSTVRRARACAPAPGGTGPEADVLVAERLGRATIRTLELLPTDSRCLVRSLVLLRLLARRSLDATLVIGVRPGPEFTAHAWVEHGGRPVLPTGGFDRLLEL